MTRSELIARLGNRNAPFVEKDAELAVKLILTTMAASLAAGRRIEIRGFGSFGLHYRAARIGHKPKTGERINIPAKYSVHFKAGKDLCERVRARLLGAAHHVNGADGPESSGRCPRLSP